MTESGPRHILSSSSARSATHQREEKIFWRSWNTYKTDPVWRSSLLQVSDYPIRYIDLSSTSLLFGPVSNSSQFLAGKGQIVTIFGVTSKWEHFARNVHEARFQYRNKGNTSSRSLYLSTLPTQFLYLIQSFLLYTGNPM